LLGFRKSWEPAISRAGASAVKVKGCAAVKKLLLLALIAIGILAVWRKVQADRAELDLWTEATTDDD
jgi:hypothetical protein